MGIAPDRQGPGESIPQPKAALCSTSAQSIYPHNSLVTSAGASSPSYRWQRRQRKSINFAQLEWGFNPASWHLEAASFCSEILQWKENLLVDLPQFHYPWLGSFFKKEWGGKQTNNFYPVLGGRQLFRDTCAVREKLCWEEKKCEEE